MKRMCLGLLLIFGAQQTLPLPAVIRTAGIAALKFLSLTSGAAAGFAIMENTSPNQTNSVIAGICIATILLNVPKKDNDQQKESTFSRLRNLIRQSLQPASLGMTTVVLIKHAVEKQQ